MVFGHGCTNMRQLALAIMLECEYEAYLTTGLDRLAKADFFRAFPWIVRNLNWKLDLT